MRGSSPSVHRGSSDESSGVGLLVRDESHEPLYNPGGEGMELLCRGHGSAGEPIVVKIDEFET